MTRRKGPLQRHREHADAVARRDERSAERKGLLFRVVVSTNAPHRRGYFGTLEQAIKERDTVFAEFDIKLPPDYFERQVSRDSLAAYVEAYQDGRWVVLNDTERRGTWNWRYRD